MTQITLLYDILKYSASSIIVGIIVTLLLVGLMFFIVKGFFPRSTFSPLSILVGLILTLFLGFRMITMCGAISLKWMCNDFETYVNSLIPDDMLQEAVPLSETDTDMIIDKSIKKFPILSQLVDSRTFAGNNIANIAEDITKTINGHLNQFIWKSILWSLACLIIAAALVVWTLKRYETTEFYDNDSWDEF